MRFPTTLCTLLLSATLSHAATIQVSQGTSINAGIARMSPGDTLEIQSGTYREVIRTRVPSGSAERPTTIKAAPGATVIIAADLAAYRASGSTSNCMVELSDVAYVIVEGVIVDMGQFHGMPSGVSSGVGGICAYGTTHHVTIQEVEIRNAKADPDYFPTGLFCARGTDSLLVQNNHIHHIGYPFPPGGNENSYYGIYCAGSNHVFDNNHIHHTGKYGMHMYDGQEQTIVNNRYSNNYIHDTQGSAILLGGAHGSIVHHNVLVGPSGRDANWAAITLGFGTSNTAIVNNTIVGCLGHPVGLRKGQTSNITIQNNLSWHCGHTGVEGAAMTLSPNLWEQDPRFANEAGGDYRLQAGSPAIDTGVSVGLPCHGPCDQGAYEVGMQTGPGSTGGRRKLLPAPTNLRALSLR